MTEPAAEPVVVDAVVVDDDDKEDEGEDGVGARFRMGCGSCTFNAKRGERK